MAKKQNSSSVTTNSGQRANHSGNRLEEFVEHALVTKGYVEFQGNKSLAFANIKALGGKQYMKQCCIGTTIYDSARTCDFFIVNERLFPHGLIIECKWQQVGGSIDEKYPFLVFNIMKTGVPTVVLLDGGGYKPAARDWLKGMADPTTSLIAVWDMAEFQKQINNGFLG